MHAQRLDRVLVATTSEFGRRVRENGSGLDHGAASSMADDRPDQVGAAGRPVGAQRSRRRGGELSGRARDAAQCSRRRTPGGCDDPFATRHDA
ncbi:DUF1501 domain-containing protein [bacterium]|nr:DUF1501 domain-containing protein [bacterium]